MKRSGLILLLCGWAWIATAWGAAPEVPPALQPWIPWVLHDLDTYRCPHPHDAPEPHFCAWPGRLQLVLDEQGGRFEQRWTVHVRSAVPLPGSAAHWPQRVQVDGEPAPVVARDGRPVVWLEAGAHRVTGELEWATLPPSLQIPPETGLLALQLRGRNEPLPRRERDGRLWLAAPGKAGGIPHAEPARLQLQVYRLLEDDVPQRLTTRLELTVSGPARELVLPPPDPEGFTAFALESPLPARLEADGRLSLQVRPGRWRIQLQARGDAPHDRLAPPARPTPWPERETWSLRTRPELRVVEVTGGTPIDPAQAGVPQDWRDLPAYVLRPGEALELHTVQRGARTQGQDRLALQRQWWLDFSGAGLTFRDHITGTLVSTPRLVVGPELTLGEVRVDGRARLITRLEQEPGPGVELRRGTLNVEAVGRFEGDPRRLPANGWAPRLDTAQTTLHLPPGWRLLGASGVGRASGAWLERWSLLDLFLVLLIAVATGRLVGWPWAAVALLATGLSWHEPGAPRYLWLNLLVAAAILRWVETPRWRRAVQAYTWAAAALLVLAALPFFVFQLRSAVYPQLERPTASAMLQEAAAPLARRAPPAPAEHLAEDAARKMSAIPALRSRSPAQDVLEAVDPNALVQTGPGVPEWTWRSVELDLPGPVEAGQQLRLWLVPPMLTRLLRVSAAALVALLVWALAGAPRPGRRKPVAGAGLVIVLIAVLPAPQAQAQAFPGPELLETLRQRLTEPPDCLPHCADIPAARLTAGPRELRVALEVHLADAAAVPLPDTPGQWTPARLRVDGEPHSALLRGPKGRLWLALEAGVHQVELWGPLPARDRIQLAWPLVPRHLEVTAEGWSVSGVGPSGVPEPSLALIRQRPQAPNPAEEPLQPLPLPGFARLERTLSLGLEWTVRYRLQRVGPGRESVTLRIPLLPGESVITPGFEVKQGAVVVRLPAERRAVQWESRLEIGPELVLTAAQSLPTGQPGWFEVWLLEAAPLWHVETEGIPPVHRLDPLRQWRPEWRPWPGETVRLRVQRPAGVPGPTVTLDRARLTIEAGETSRAGTLLIDLHTSRGGTHSLTLPSGARLDRVEMDGASLPVQAVQGRVTVALEPGRHRIRVGWHEAEPPGHLLRTPAVDLGAPAVNLGLDIALGPGRWVLAVGGPPLGPAVLFWGVLVVLAALAWVLARLRLAPLGAAGWFLLLVGLTQTPLVLGAVVVGWLLLTGLRSRWRRPLSPVYYNLLQGATGSLTLLALVALFLAVQQGLLGLPDMQVTGNGSTAAHLYWYQDRTAPRPPTAWALWVPLWVYRMLMLAWALWLAFAVVGWLRWAWGVATRDGLWKREVPPPPAPGNP